MTTEQQISDLTEKLNKLTESVIEVREKQIRYEERFDALVTKLDTQTVSINSLISKLDSTESDINRLKYLPAVNAQKGVKDMYKWIGSASIGAIVIIIIESITRVFAQ